MTGIKRTNPETNAPFKYGDVREDGYVFWSYQMHAVRKDGTYAEKWRAPEIFTKAKAQVQKRKEGVKRINSATAEPFVSGYVNLRKWFSFLRVSDVSESRQRWLFC